MFQTGMWRISGVKQTACGQKFFEVLVIGNHSSGKSTFINKLLGKEAWELAVTRKTKMVNKYIEISINGKTPIAGWLRMDNALLNSLHLMWVKLRKKYRGFLCHVGTPLDGWFIVDTPIKMS